MARGNRKTLGFKDRQCQYCKKANKSAFRKGQPCCPLPNPRIKNGHCKDRDPSGKEPKKMKANAK